LSTNTETVERYIDGFNKNDHDQILGCLTDDIKWTVFGGFQLTGKAAYDAAIENDFFVAPPQIELTRLVEQDDVVMAEAVGEVKKAAGGIFRLAMAEVFVMQDGLISERKAYVIELKENDFK
jgi:ketosteroid isomerase-like protein